jgi:hypothetical protein
MTLVTDLENFGLTGSRASHEARERHGTRVVALSRCIGSALLMGHRTTSLTRDVASGAAKMGRAPLAAAVRKVTKVRQVCSPPQNQ